MMPLALFLLALFVLYVGTVRAAFTAMLGMSVRFLLERQSRGDLLASYLEQPELLFVPARLFIGATIVGATVLLLMVVGREPPADLALLLGALLATGIVCEQVLPQLIVRRNPQAVLEFLLPSFGILASAVAPLTRAMVSVSRLRGWQGRELDETEVEAEDEHPAQSPNDDGGPHDQGPDRHLLLSLVDFGERLVREVMTPRPDVVGIEADATLEDLRRLFREQEYSRIPVYGENLDNIQGFVFVKDLIRHDVAAGDTRPVTTLMRPAYFVPETKPLAELLKEFQRRQVQAAIVVDEYGGTAGLVTIEDLLEEIVGEIRDEYDVESEPIVDEGGGVFVFSAKVNVDDLAERLDVDIDAEGFETVGGYLLTHLGRVPAYGEVFDIDGLHIEVVEAERRRIKRVRVRRLETILDRN
jgi:CBS domain containing-hemolysin-like protein